MTSLFPRKFRFGTKAETLARIAANLRKSVVPPHWHFTVADWANDPDAVRDRICAELGADKIIVRSSAIAEDGTLSTMAGSFLSVPDVDPNDAAQLTAAVDAVIASYAEGGSKHERNQVLVQTQIRAVSMSGVLLTQDLSTGSPYYVINYEDETGRTDVITSGTGYNNRTLLLHRAHWSSLRSERMQALIEAVREIEQHVDSDCLDIEFAVDADHRIYLFQVRQIATATNWNRGIALKVNDAVLRAQAFFAERSRPVSGLYGRRAILTRMSDWNPAEMIGSAPRALALSLYRQLITDSAWRRARSRMGYADPVGWPLMCVLGGQPFIDVRLSFHSYLPASLPEPIAHRLVDAWLDRLEQNPHLHDKVEFDVAITSLAFDFDERVDAQFPGVLNAGELATFKESLRRLTLDLVEGRVANVEVQRAAVDLLDLRRKKLMADASEPTLTLVAALLEDCVELGTVPFAILARHAFITESLLRSLVGRGALSKERLAEFHRSISTVSSELIADIERFGRGELSRAELMERYGHLRPGTYDILSLRYDQREVLANEGVARSGVHALAPEFVLTAKERDAVAHLLAQEGFTLAPEALFRYCQQAIQGREYAKFLFTRSVSDALEALAAWGARAGLSRQELSHIDLNQILDVSVHARERSVESYLRQCAERGQREYETTTAIRLPHQVASAADIVVIPLMLHAPNFITTLAVHADVIAITGASADPEAIDGKIVLIESADPGFDWIFARPIKGLITKFGGANSHMAIRCAEFGLPAAIGCGEQIFDRVVRGSAVDLNCAEGRITPLEKS